MVKRAHLAAYASRDETSPGPYYGLRRHPTPQKDFVRICQQHLELSEKFIKLPYPVVVKILLKNSYICIVVKLTTKI